MSQPWTLDELQLGEDQVELAAEIIFEALEDFEYFDWISEGDAMTFTPETAALVERALKDAHRERREAAKIALRRLLNVNRRAMDEVRASLEVE